MPVDILYNLNHLDRHSPGLSAAIMTFASNLPPRFLPHFACSTSGPAHTELRLETSQLAAAVRLPPCASRRPHPGARRPRRERAADSAHHRVGHWRRRRPRRAPAAHQFRRPRVPGDLLAHVSPRAAQQSCSGVIASPDSLSSRMSFLAHSMAGRFLI